VHGLHVISSQLIVCDIRVFRLVLIEGRFRGGLSEEHVTVGVGEGFLYEAGSQGLAFIPTHSVVLGGADVVEVG